MSWQAVEAVRDHSKVSDPSGRLILMVIASYTRPDGTMNGLKKPPAVETLADGAGCHKNTVLNWIPKLEETGELSVERIGKGRGSKNYYTINLPIMVQETVQTDSPITSNGTSQSVPLSRDNGTSQLVEMVQKMAQAVLETQRMVQVMVHNGTSQSVPVTEYKTEIKTEEEELSATPIPPTPPKPESNHQKLMRLYQEVLGYSMTNGAAEGKAAKNLLSQYTVDEAIACYKDLKQDSFWSGKHLSLANVHKQLGAWKQGLENPPPITLNGRHPHKPEPKKVVGEF